VIFSGEGTGAADKCSSPSIAAKAAAWQWRHFQRVCARPGLIDPDNEGRTGPRRGEVASEITQVNPTTSTAEILDDTGIRQGMRPSAQGDATVTRKYFD